MSQNHPPSNNSADDVTYVLHRGVRTAMRKLPQQSSAEGQTSQKPLPPPLERALPPVISPQAPPGAGPMAIKKVSPSQAKPWLDDSIVLPTNPSDNAPKAKIDTPIPPVVAPKMVVAPQAATTPVASQLSTQVGAAALCDALLPGSVALAQSVVTHEEANSSTEDTESDNNESRIPQISLRQLPLLQRPQLRPAIQLPPLFARAEVVQGKMDDATTLMDLATEPLLPLRKNSSSTQSGESISNAMLLREIEQLRAGMDEMKHMIQQLQAQLAQK